MWGRDGKREPYEQRMPTWQEAHEVDDPRPGPKKAPDLSSRAATAELAAQRAAVSKDLRWAAGVASGGPNEPVVRALAQVVAELRIMAEEQRIANGQPSVEAD